jgi:hypothetical protein
MSGKVLQLIRSLSSDVCAVLDSTSEDSDTDSNNARYATNIRTGASVVVAFSLAAISPALPFREIQKTHF